MIAETLFCVYPDTSACFEPCSETKNACHFFSLIIQGVTTLLRCYFVEERMQIQLTWNAHWSLRVFSHEANPNPALQSTGVHFGIHTLLNSVVVGIAKSLAHTMKSTITPCLLLFILSYSWLISIFLPYYLWSFRGDRQVMHTHILLWLRSPLLLLVK